jgi:hypothetical protein
MSIASLADSVTSKSLFLGRMHSEYHYTSTLCRIKQKEASQPVDLSSIVTTRCPKMRGQKGQKTRRARSTRTSSKPPSPSKLAVFDNNNGFLPFPPFRDRHRSDGFRRRCSG